MARRSLETGRQVKGGMCVSFIVRGARTSSGSCRNPGLCVCAHVRVYTVDGCLPSLDIYYICTEVTTVKSQSEYV